MGVYTKKFVEALQPDPYVDLVEWSDTYRQLPRESSIEPGKYRTSRVPYVREILYELSPQSSTTEVIVIKPTQTGFTELANNFLFSIAHRYPGPCMMAFPTDDMAKKHSKKKISTSLRAMDCLQEIIKPSRSRDSGNTLSLKEFPGGSWTFTGSNSPTSARSDSIRYLILDDFDGFVDDIGGEGDPGQLFRKRTDAFGTKRKVYINSTPTLKKSSKIAREFKTSSQGYYHVPCPHCGHFQYMVFGGEDVEHGLKFKRNEHNEILDVWYVCEKCHTRIDEHHKTKMLEDGKYVHVFPTRRKRGFKINSLYSPVGWVSWAQVAQEFLEAKGDKGKLQVWTNTRMAEPWQDYHGAKDVDIILALMDDRPEGLVPSDGVACLVAGTDTQKYGLWYEIRAFGFGLAQDSWQIRHGYVSSLEALAQVLFLDEYLDSQGRKYIVQYTVMDAMGGTQRQNIGIGTRTAEVYDFTRQWPGRISPFKGEMRMNAPFAYSNIECYPGTNKPIPGGLQLLRGNVTYYKNLLSQKLDISPGDPGSWKMCADLRKDWAGHMTVEYLNDKGLWECPDGKENHGWDCSVYSLVAADVIGVKHWPKPGQQPEAPAQKRKPRQDDSRGRGKPKWFGRR